MLGPDGVTYAPLINEHSPGLRGGFLGCRMWQAHHTEHRILPPPRLELCLCVEGLRTGPWQMWIWAGCEADSWLGGLVKDLIFFLLADYIHSPVTMKMQ